MMAAMGRDLKIDVVDHSTVIVFGNHWCATAKSCLGAANVAKNCPDNFEVACHCLKQRTAEKCVVARLGREDLGYTDFPDRPESPCICPEPVDA